MREDWRILRWLALVAVGAIGLHQLRYLAGDPGHGHGAISAHAHAYLPLAAALVLLVFLAAVAHFACTLMLARGGDLRSRRPLRYSRAWPLATFLLLAIFFTQESFEGALLAGHSSGLHGLLGHGGWSVLVFAPLIGALIALLLRGAQHILEAATRRVRRVRQRPTRGRWRLLPDSAAAPLDAVARNLAGRAPPALS
jgi:hypothetical protein